MRRGWLTALAVSAALWAGQPTGSRAQQPPPVPLAYVRTIWVAPVTLRVAPDTPMSPEPPPSHKRARGRWLAEVARRAAAASLREAARAALDREVRARLAGLPGILLRGNAPAGGADHGAAAPDVADGEWLAERAREAQADASLAVHMDGFGTATGLERVVWLRVRFWLVTAAAKTIRRPFHAYGHASAGRKLFQSVFARTDQELADAAAAHAARLVVRCLDTGYQSPFAGGVRIAVAPAHIPARATVLSGTDEPRLLPIPSVVRQADVLFHPDLCPAAAVASVRDVRAALARAPFSPAALWTDLGKPDAGPVGELAQKLGAGLVMLTRVPEATVTRERLPNLGGAARTALRARVRAECYLVDAGTGRVAWWVRVDGDVGARTDTGGAGRDSDRRMEQCVMDAARIASARLNYEVNLYRVKNDR